MFKHYQIRAIYPLVGTVISLAFFVFYRNIGFNKIISSTITTLGLIIWWTATITLKTSFSLIPKASGIIQNGIYSKIRHPVYVGLLITNIGWIILTRSVPVILLVIGITLSSIIRMLLEEKKLIKTFGEKYITYKKQTWF